MRVLTWLRPSAWPFFQPSPSSISNMKSLPFLIAWSVTVTAHAVDTSSVSDPETFPTHPMYQAREAIKSEQFDKAVELLKKAEQKHSADWNNLMGFSLRKKSPPDLRNAEVFYKAALALDPLHRGALEYYGELLLIRNDLTGAEALLNRLGKACPLDCEEYRDLEAGIMSFKLRK